MSSEHSQTKRGVLYLRVSSASQVGTDYDPEGLSIPAQRNVCRQRAAQLGIEIVDEYVELGKSGTSVTKRPQFQEMLRRIKEQRDVEYVVVYKLSRLNRNRVDDAMVLVQMRAMRVTLVSATENIDATPEGQLMHGVLASFNEYRSAADGADIRVKMRRKAEQGGTISRAPLGYLNTREALEDRIVSTVIIDPERGALVRKAFELYATGEYSLDRLQSTMADLGLTARPSRRWPDRREVSLNKLHQMLRDPYYVGQITYQDEVYEGRHEPLVTRQLFDRVQDVLKIRSQGGSRDRVHLHYLKGLLLCARCHESGRRFRLVYNEAHGKGGTYAYYLCRGRQEGVCDLPYLPVPAVERAVLDHMKTVRLPVAFAERASDEVKAAVDDSRQTVHDLNKANQRRLAELDQKEERLLDLAEDGELPQGRLKSRLRRLADERARLTLDRVEIDRQLSIGANALTAAFGLMRDVQDLYANAVDDVRGYIAHSVFGALYLDQTDVVDSDLKEPFSSVIETSRSRRGANEKRPDRLVGALRLGDVLDSTGVTHPSGSSRSLLAEDRGFEPLRAFTPNPLSKRAP
jgi:site-specific DNA recombinase